MAVRLIRSCSSEVRIAAAEDWLGRRSASEQLLVVAPSSASAGELLRRAAVARGAVFGWQRMTLGRLAAALAAPQLTEEGRTVVGGLATQALAARVIHGLGLDALGRYAPVGDKPGFATALAQTFGELRLARVDAERVAAVDPDLARMHELYEQELRTAGLADHGTLYRMALAAAREGEQWPLGLPLLLLDLPLESAAERELVAALAAAAPDVLATVPEGDRLGTLQLERALGVTAESFDTEPPEGALARMQRYLFVGETPPSGELDDGVSIFSAPGESRECVELVRRVLLEAERGVPFDRMAILVHPVHEYRRHLEEALGRGGVPAHFARGAVAPDPSGRALLSLLSCAVEDLSARRFAEYLSLGEVPRADEGGAPPPAVPSSERWVPPDEETLPEFLAAVTASLEISERERRAREEDADPRWPDPDVEGVRAGTLRAPRRWEQLINDAAVIGGHARWVRRLDGLARELAHRLEGIEEPEEPIADAIRRDLADLERLRAFALPLLDQLAELVRLQQASWGEWLDRLSALASRALRHPSRVLAVLAELAPMAPIGPVGLAEVRLVLTRRLTEMVVPPSEKRYGAVLVAPPEAIRGLAAFDVVFVPGLAERLFPRRILEDPVLPDSARVLLDEGLATDEQRVERERLALRLAVGAARQRLVLSYARLDLQHARPRVPSFYCLEALRAVQGRLEGFAELSRRAEVSGAARLSWPAPERPRQAIDEAEHDLALLERILRQEPAEGAAELAHLLTTNAHLGRAVRFRVQRWGTKWTQADGLVRPSPSAKEALAEHQLAARSYSPTALQNYALCPYRFLLHAIHRLSPREVPGPIDEMNPLQRGALVHEIQFLLFRELDRAGLLPVTPENLHLAQDALEQVVIQEAARKRDEFAPAIERVWEDGVAAVRADLREWLRLAALEEEGWTPWRFEYSFGLPTGHAGHDTEMQDPHSTAEPAALACGVRLRGKIDLVERNAAGHLRVTDHKTGKVRVKKGAVVEGGQALQPLLYALAARQLLGSSVECGRLYYCTMAGGFEERTVPLTPETEQVADEVARAIRLALERGFLPAAPAERACEFCDYRPVCGQDEERRVSRKGKRALKELLELRKLP